MQIRAAQRLFAIVLCLTSVFAAIAKERNLQSLSPEQRSEALSQFILRKKFMPEGYYPGATNEADRIRFEQRVNSLAERLLHLPPIEQTKVNVLEQFRPTMEEFEEADSEERDRFLQYLEDLMDIFAIESSDGLLNKWRYGFDPKESPDTANANALAAMTQDERTLLESLSGISASTAKETLVKLLGPASANSGPMSIWYLKPDASSAIALSVHSGVTVFSWLAKSRFMYSRKL